MYVVDQELYQLEELLLYSVWLLGNFLCRLTQCVLVLEIIILWKCLLLSQLVANL